jgi:sugar lactone lactonase YvrE
VSTDAVGNLYIADTCNNRIRKVSLDGVITTVAGGGPSAMSAGGYYQPGYWGDGGRAIDAELKQPDAVAVDAAGNIYIADTGNFRVRKVTSDGIITTVAGNGIWSWDNPAGK